MLIGLLEDVRAGERTEDAVIGVNPRSSCKSSLIFPSLVASMESGGDGHRQRERLPGFRSRNDL